MRVLANRCTVCLHPNRLQIERAILLNEGGVRPLARTYGVSPQALLRHRGRKAYSPRSHMGIMLAKPAELAADMIHDSRGMPPELLTIVPPWSPPVPSAPVLQRPSLDPTFMRLFMR